MGVGDSISSRQLKEISKLRLRGRKTILLLVVLPITLFILLTFYFSSDVENGGLDPFYQSRGALIASGEPWARTLLDRQNVYRSWLESYGTQSEVKLFNSVSTVLFNTALASEGSGTRGFYISLHFGLLRIAFMVIASWRLWFFAGLVGLVLGSRSTKVHVGHDLLGETGNGRLFYSGIRASLAKVAKNGAPDLLVTGLACPAKAPLALVKSSSLARVLEKYSALNETNLNLAAVILQRTDLRAYVAPSGEEALLANYFEDETTLTDMVPLILEAALKLWQRTKELSSEDPEAQSASDNTQSQKVNRYQYADLLAAALERVLGAQMKETLGRLTAAEIAALVLAVEAGKVMTFSNQGGVWRRASAFQQLNARAILHSIPAFSQEYDYESRQDIRRALVYGSRSSIFGPVRFPADLSPRSAVLRQMVEILLACPYELQSVGDDTELFGIVSEVNKSWSQLFLNRLMALDPTLTGQIYTTPSETIFIPMLTLLDLLKESVEPAQFKRLEELVALVSQRQRLDTLSLEFSGETDLHQLRGSERIFSPIAFPEVKRLAEAHKLSLEQVKEWSAARTVFNAFGWLARRVGDHSVPESSLIFAVLEVGQGTNGANEHGLIGKSGMVALRSTHVEAKWGKSWQTRFMQAESAKMAENQEEFDKLMRGIEETFAEDSENPSSITA